MSATTEAEDRRDIVAVAHSLFDRGYTHGSTGNISVRTARGILVTPTGVSLGFVTADELSLIADDGTLLDGPPATKEAFLHAAVLGARPQDRAAVHTHSLHAAAISCLTGLDEDNVLPRLTAYYTMRIERLPLLPYYAPGDSRLGPIARQHAATTNALLLRNHGPIVSGRTVQAAADALEELEQTARLYFLVAGRDLNLVAEETPTG